MNITEYLYVQLSHKQHLLIEEQNPAEENPLFKFITPTPPTPTIKTAATSGILIYSHSTVYKTPKQYALQTRQHTKQAGMSFNKSKVNINEIRQENHISN
jgi:hypothetical protein